MAQQIKKKFIESDAIDQSKILLDHQGALRSKDSSDQVVNLIKLNANDKVQISNLEDGSAVGDAVNKGQLDAVDTRVTAIENDYGVANGLATLDGSGKVPVSQLPSALMTYEGVWDASLNSPSLADGVGDAGMVYRVGTAGSQDLGSGSISFEVGDYVIYNGSVWEKSDTTDSVASVFGRSGLVTAESGDYNAAQITYGATNVGTALDDLITLSGVSVNSQDLGIFSGITIADNSTIKDALQALESAVESIEGGGSLTQLELDATQVGAGLNGDGTYSANGGSFIISTATSLKNADDLLDAALQDVIALSGVAVNSQDLGLFTGATIPANSTIKVALQSLETSLEQAISDVDVNKADVDLSNLTNTVIPTGVSLNSDSIVQVNDATQFELRTVDQTTSVSGNVKVRSGNVDAGDYTSGAIRVTTGNSSNPAKASAGALATGLMTLATGSITASAGATQGSAGNFNIIGGDINGAGTHTGSTGLMFIRSGNINNANNSGNTGDAVFLSGSNSGAGNSGVVGIRSGEVFGTGNSGSFFFFSGRSASGNSGDMLYQTGAISSVAPGYPGGFANSSNTSGSTGNLSMSTGLINIASNTGNTGVINIFTGNHSGTASGNSGDINLTTGTVVGGVRGIISLNALNVDFNGIQAKNLADPTDAQDAATKNYVDISMPIWSSQKITIEQSHIDNGYIDLAVEVVEQSIHAFVDRLAIHRIDDFTVSVVSNVTRISFAGELLPAGASPLAVGDNIYVRYQY